jgi:nickel-dependent lactate racemase
MDTGIESISCFWLRKPKGRVQLFSFSFDLRYSNDMCNTYSLRVSAWEGEHELGIYFPQEWEVFFSPMAGHNAPPVRDDQMREAFSKPIKSPPIHEAAKGKDQVVILFDDLTRPTPSQRIVPFILEELKRAGIEDDQIRFIAAIGGHRPLDPGELIAKLGRLVTERFRVFNHNPFDNLVHVGTTSRGTRVLLNREVKDCNYKIGVGCVIPHLTAGFGGGGKILSVGACGLETLRHSHFMITRCGALNGTRDPRVGVGKVKENPFRLDLEEAAQIGGLNVQIDAVVNGVRQVAGLFVGDPVAEHRTAVDFAKTVYTTHAPTGMDVVVANSYPIEGQLDKVLWTGDLYLREGGTFVVIRMAKSGSSHHYLIGRFGTHYGGPVWEPTRCKVKKAGRVLHLSPHLFKVDKEWWGKGENVVWCKSWEQILNELKKSHGKGAKVAVFPTASIQCPPVPKDY